MIKTLFKLISILIIISTFVTAWYWNEYNVSLQTPIALPQNNSTQTLFSVNKGDRAQNIAENLKSQSIIQNPLYFRVYARLSHKAVKIKAGEYVLKPGMTAVDVIE